MLTVVGILLGGVLCGFLLRKRKLKWLPGFITVAIWTLLFALGMAVGSHEELLNHWISLVGRLCYLVRGQFWGVWCCRVWFIIFSIRIGVNDK